MPFYDYKCGNCGHIVEEFHGMNESPSIECDECSVVMTKVPNMVHASCGEGQHDNSPAGKASREKDMRKELKEEFGVHDFTPLNGASTEDVYKDAKQQGGFVKEKMAASAEAENKKVRRKQQEWKRKAEKRAPQRAQEKKEQRAKEDQEKRKIRL